MEQQKYQRALALLAPVFATSEGHDTADLKDAQRVLAALER